MVRVKEVEAGAGGEERDEEREGGGRERAGSEPFICRTALSSLSLFLLPPLFFCQSASQSASRDGPKDKEKFSGCVRKVITAERDTSPSNNGNMRCGISANIAHRFAAA